MGIDLLSHPALPGKCGACDITIIYPVEFTNIKSRAMTFSRSPECMAFSRAVMDKKSLSLPFPIVVIIQMTGA